MANAMKQEELHAKTFGAWVNAKLRVREMRVDDITRDFSTGIKLIVLAEILTGQHCPSRYNTNPTLRIHSLDNIAIALRFLGQYVPGLNFEPADIESGNRKIILALLWRLILHFQLGKELSLINGGISTKTDGNLPDILLRWLQHQTQGYPNVNVTDYRTSFGDGVAFC